MSQKNQSHEHGNAEHAPKAERNQQTPPITDVSPDDPYPVPVDPGSGRPGRPQK